MLHSKDAQILSMLILICPDKTLTAAGFLIPIHLATAPCGYIATLPECIFETETSRQLTERVRLGDRLLAVNTGDATRLEMSPRLGDPPPPPPPPRLVPGHLPGAGEAGLLLARAGPPPARRYSAEAEVGGVIFRRG